MTLPFNTCRFLSPLEVVVRVAAPNVRVAQEGYTQGNGTQFSLEREQNIKQNRMYLISLGLHSMVAKKPLQMKVTVMLYSNRTNSAVAQQIADWLASPLLMDELPGLCQMPSGVSMHDELANASSGVNDEDQVELWASGESSASASDGTDDEQPFLREELSHLGEQSIKSILRKQVRVTQRQTTSALAVGDELDGQERQANFAPRRPQHRMKDGDAICAELEAGGWESMRSTDADAGCPIVAWRQNALTDDATHLLALQRGVQRAKEAGCADKKTSRADNMVHRGWTATQGSQTLRKHFFTVEGATIPTASIEAYSATGDMEPLENLKCMAVPYKHMGDVPELDIELAAHASTSWAKISAASPTLAAVQSGAVPPGARGITADAPWTAASLYGSKAAASKPTASLPSALDDENDLANKWHVDWRDVLHALAFITHVGLDACGARATLAGGTLRILYGITCEPHQYGMIFDASLGAQNIGAVVDICVQAGGGMAKYPNTLGAVRGAIQSGCALMIEIPAGASVLAEVNKLWHCVTGLHPRLDMGLERFSTICYAHTQVCTAVKLLGCPGDLNAPHPAIATFNTPSEALRWRTVYQNVLPPRLVRPVHDYALLVAENRLPYFDAAPEPEYSMTGGVLCDLKGMSVWLAQEVVAQTVFMSLCGSPLLAQEVCDPARLTALVALHSEWRRLHHNVFFPPMRSGDEPRHGLLQSLEAEDDSFCIVALFLSTQVDFGTLYGLLTTGRADLLGAAQGCETSITRVLDAVCAGRARQRLQPLSTTKPDEHGRIPMITALRHLATTHPPLSPMRARRGANARQKLFDLLRKSPYVGQVIATIMTREVRALKLCGLALYSAKATVMFGDAPASRILAFVDPDERDRLTRSELSKLAATAGIALVGTLLQDMQKAWEALKLSYPAMDCKSINSFMEQALLTASPELDEVENYLCEVGKGLVGRALASKAMHGPVLGSRPMAPLCGYHVPQRSTEANQYRFGGSIGPMVKLYDADKNITGMMPWTLLQRLRAT